MKRLADDKRSQPKERIISVRISHHQEEIFAAAMGRDGIPFLSRFARIAMLELAERTLRPVDFTAVKLQRDLAAQTTKLKRRIQTIELNLAANPENANLYQVSELIEMVRNLLLVIREIEQRQN